MDQVREAFPTRLYWAGFRGIIRVAGHEARLKAPPKLAGVQTEAVDYIPGVLAQVMPRGAGWRDMTAAERRAADALLGREDATLCVVFDNTRRRPLKPSV